MSALLERRFLVVTGKGGVGKTTVAACLGLAAAARGRRVLLALSSSKEHVSHMLGVPALDTRHVEVAPGLEAVRMTPERSLEEYGMMILKLRPLYHAVFENRFVAPFIRGTPGVAAWSMLGKAAYHAEEQRGDGAARYDLVILDAPATGNGLEMLRIPKVIRQFVPPGLLRRDADRTWNLLTDGQRSGVVLVTLPEELPVDETLELAHALDADLGLPLAALVVNRVTPELFHPGDDQMLKRARLAAPDEPARQALGIAEQRARSETRERDQIARLGQLTAPHYELPRVPGTDLTRRDVDALATTFTREAIR